MSDQTTPENVQITIVTDPAARPLSQRIAELFSRTRTRARGMVGVGVGVAVVGLIVAGTLLVSGALTGSHAGATRRQAPAVAAANGHSPRVGGWWRPALAAAGYRCPVSGLSQSVQVELGVCP
jgi:hypothetical protein